MMYYRLKSFLEQHNILHDSQYAFREKRSTGHALLDIINQIETNMGAELYSGDFYRPTKGLSEENDYIDLSVLITRIY